MNNLLSYCGLKDSKMRASDTDLPVHSSNLYFNIFLSITESQPGTPSKTAKKEAELGASEFKLQKNAEVYSEPISAETLSNGTAKEAAPAQRNISCLSDANTAAGSAQREVVVSTA